MPTKWDLTLPIMKYMIDKKAHPIREIIPDIASELELSPQEREERLKSGERRFNNRVRWATWVLTQARLLNRTGTGTFKITEKGLKALESNPKKMDRQFLMQFKEFEEAVKSWRGTSAESSEAEIADQDEETPEEIVENAHRKHNEILAAELLDIIMNCSYQFFEQLVVDLILAMGYGGSRADAGDALVGGPGDGGIDGIVKEDLLGLDSIYIQAKRWEGTVGADVVRNFVGGLELKKAKKGIIITTSSFSQPARDYVRQIERKVALVDGKQLGELMIEHDIGVSKVADYTIKRLDSEYFEQ